MGRFGWIDMEASKAYLKSEQDKIFIGPSQVYKYLKKIYSKYDI